LFSIVGQDLAGMRILDAFGGTGLLGLEAWSRGAAVVIVERDPRTAREIRANADALGATVDVRVGDVLLTAAQLGRFDGILVDPPYRDDPGPIVQRLASLADHWLVLETDERTEAPPVDALALDPRRGYGGTAEPCSARTHCSTKPSAGAAARGPGRSPGSRSARAASARRSPPAASAGSAAPVARTWSASPVPRGPGSPPSWTSS
jgi:16S rRNA G966 N2-methylase RsmD